MTLGDTLGHARTLLFVPADRPERFAKATASAADGIILDLEDAVGAEHKSTARQHVAEYLRAGNSAVVRINAPGTPWHDDDVAMIRRHTCGVMTPKAEDPEILAELHRASPHHPLIPLLETATGLLDARELCRVDGVVRPAFGNVDLAAELGVDPADQQALRHARSSLVLAAKSVEVAAPLDGVTTAVRDDTALARDAEHAASLGFTGKLCIHPGQVAQATTAFTPSPDLVRWARKLLRDSNDGAATLVDGQMVDTPVLERARAVLARAGA
ncbi:CoA ester lyase [Allosaccharopolyspora coralli]|uniref:CoA ester lyase n=1 Tax=Allosaccharopolyspora coralli TaxID=2665642 RepID=A0A5Q3Q7V2_9PSEU|nr:CoA ester lyase [Allosaccharopolyspora coralli]QGK70443.1 CoA ester lyase [Allosaccharopolyspora coralli]